MAVFDAPFLGRLWTDVAKIWYFWSHPGRKSNKFIVSAKSIYRSSKNMHLRCDHLTQILKANYGKLNLKDTVCLKRDGRGRGPCNLYEDIVMFPDRHCITCGVDKMPIYMHYVQQQIKPKSNQSLHSLKHQ